LVVSTREPEDGPMEPLNLMVSLSHFANDKRENKHGLGERAGRRCAEKQPGRPEKQPRRIALARNARRIWPSRVRVLP